MNPATKLGLLLGAAVLLLIMILVLAFSRWGLPKDPEAWKRQQQIESMVKP
jgi:hypothetical protein